MFPVRILSQPFFTWEAPHSQRLTLIHARNTVNICWEDFHDMIGISHSQAIQKHLKTELWGTRLRNFHGEHVETGFHPHKGHEADGKASGGWKVSWEAVTWQSVCAAFLPRCSSPSPTWLSSASLDFICRHTVLNLLWGERLDVKLPGCWMCSGKISTGHNEMPSVVCSLWAPEPCVWGQDGRGRGGSGREETRDLALNNSGFTLHTPSLLGKVT